MSLRSLTGSPEGFLYAQEITQNPADGLDQKRSVFCTRRYAHGVSPAQIEVRKQSPERRRQLNLKQQIGPGIVAAIVVVVVLILGVLAWRTFQSPSASSGPNPYQGSGGRPPGPPTGTSAGSPGMPPGGMGGPGSGMPGGGPPGSGMPGSSGP